MERPKEPAKNPITPTLDHIDLHEQGIDESLAAELRAGFATFAEDWDAPEMDIYDRGFLSRPSERGELRHVDMLRLVGEPIRPFNRIC